MSAYFRKLVGGELYVNPADVLFYAFDALSAWDRHNPRLLRQQPAQGYARRRGGFLQGKASDIFYKLHVVA